MLEGHRGWPSQRPPLHRADTEAQRGEARYQGPRAA